MSFELTTFSSSIIKKQAINEIIKCNDFTENFGLILTHNQAVELVETRSYALKANRRIEFGGGVIDKIIKEFCNSPYISMDNYAEILRELVEMFYYYKNETLDLVSDDDLIKFMGKAFNEVCQGSLELLSNRELANMAQNIRFGYNSNYKESEDEDNDEKGEY
ncbi:hypothetical protein J2Z76_002404 [Sedimentibacter acidaminivorans]|uniref:Uncharacterized protein n=1 Tax=Sedimentibacter acidaminivorans TaxID=913099 RepID=A0ABS4GGN0_9FIRM|nr:DUF6323 family protein [Sedimentibacter acidaminivorans]MBP1926535.1 hypothetical protein [Sedimentibacter acidaminivorans]